MIPLTGYLAMKSPSEADIISDQSHRQERVMWLSIQLINVRQK